MVTSTITVQNKKYTYTISPSKCEKGAIHFVCKAAKIDQEFLAEDIGALILDLPALIVAEKKYDTTQSEVVRFRVSVEDKKKIEQKAVAKGFDSVSDYLRAIAVSA
jgi:hypothetical protein